MRRAHLALIALLLTLVGTLVVPGGLAPAVLATPAGGPGETRALWVVRDSLTSPASITAVVDHAVANGFNTLLVQVRGRGDAYFRGGLEPRAHVLGTQPASFDPLATVLTSAHAAGLQVHAWVNVNLVASANLLPTSPEHVANRHPEWLMVPRRLAADLAAQSVRGPGHVGKLARWARLQSDEVEGLFLSPVVPAAADYTVEVITDLVRRYPVDGLHLDYLRYPTAEFDYSRLALEEFARAFGPSLPSPRRAELTKRAADDVLAWADAYPQEWAAFRRSRLTTLVMRLRTGAKAARPSLVVSAAVFPDARAALVNRLQDWELWAETGLLDVLCPMAYTTDLDTFRSQIRDAVRTSPPAVIWAGIGAYRLPPKQTVAHIAAARAAGARGIALFSYDTIAAGSAGAYLDTVRRAAFDGAADSR